MAAIFVCTPAFARLHKPTVGGCYVIQTALSILMFTTSHKM